MNPEVIMVMIPQFADQNMPLEVYAGLVALPLVMLATMHFGFGRQISDIREDLQAVKTKQQDHTERLKDLDKWG